MDVLDASGGLLALALRDGHSRVYDAETADCIAVIRASGSKPTAFALHTVHERPRLFAGTEDGTVMPIK